MTKSRELDEEQKQDADVNKRHYSEDVKLYQSLFNRTKPYLTKSNIGNLKDTLPGK